MKYENFFFVLTWHFYFSSVFELTIDMRMRKYTTLTFILCANNKSIDNGCNFELKVSGKSQVMEARKVFSYFYTLLSLAMSIPLQIIYHTRAVVQYVNRNRTTIVCVISILFNSHRNSFPFLLWNVYRVKQVFLLRRGGNYCPRRGPRGLGWELELPNEGDLPP